MSQSRKRHEPWRANERHYCAVCNSWMGSDRQSILIHENGKKHRENMEASLQKRRDEKLQSEKDQKFLADSLKKMEQAAALAHVNDVASGTFYGGTLSLNDQISIGNADKSGHAGQEAEVKSEMNSWQNRKNKRKNIDETNEEVTSCKIIKKQMVRKKLAPDEGHYKIGQKTYLEGSTYYPICEEDMPVQIWTGSKTTSAEYRKSEEAMSFWKMGIVIRINAVKEDDAKNLQPTFDVSYLNNINDDDETIDKEVPVDQIRLILGSDDLIPKTIEESRLQLMGGEEVINIDDGGIEVDENTGLSTFRTVSVRKVTVSQQVKDERARIRAKRREELEKEKMKSKEIEARKMEEAKHTNADDSALGAYDIWGRGGYKGININAEVKLDVSDTAKSLSQGMTNVKFKKRTSNKNSMFKATKKKQNRRKTYADSDEE